MAAISERSLETSATGASRPSSARDPRYLPPAGVSVLLSLYLSWQVLDWIPLSRELVGDSLLFALALCAAFAAWRASRRCARSLRSRGAWRLVCFALLGQASGQLVQFIYEYSHVTAYPSWADPLYLSFYPLLLAGVLRFPAARRSRGQAWELALDSAIVTLGGGAVFIYFILGPNAVAARTPLQTLDSVAYPVGDMILLLALGSALMREPLNEVKRTLRPLAIAVAMFACADLAFDYVLLHGTYHGGDPIDTTYAVALACFALVAARQPALDGPIESGQARAEPGGHSSWLPYVAIGAGAVTVVAKEVGRPLFPDLSIAIIVALIGLLVVLRQGLSQRLVRQSRSRLAQAQEIAQVGSWEWDVERDVLERSAEDLRLHGLDGRAAHGTREASREAIHPDDLERVHDAIDAAIASRSPFAFEMRILRPDGEVRTLLTRGEVVAQGGRVRWVRGTHQDITDRKRMEVQLTYQADHDSLTGLYNRRKFGEELDAMLRRSHRYRRPGALLMLDLDDFKVVNDTRGHAAGDMALQALAEAIRSRVRSQDVLARLGGDEFAVVLPEVDRSQAVAIAQDIRAGVRARSGEPPIRVTCGVVLFDGATELAADDALIAADIALYEAKERGKDRVQVYHGNSGAAVTWVGRIRQALAEGRLVLYAQPILDLASGVVMHSELLVRMLSEQGEVIPPGAFLPTAERFGLINEIDRWVTREGLRLAVAGERVSINLAAQSIGDGAILDELRGALEEGLDPDGVIFEITESAAMRNMQEARVFAEALIELGCQVALDDFGTGFGSFTYLKHLPARYLKIDMEFVREMVFNAVDRQVVDAITRVAHSMGKLTIAEGVEDAATLHALRDFGVDRAQGYFVGRPTRISPPTAMERAALAHGAGIVPARSLSG